SASSMTSGNTGDGRRTVAQIPATRTSPTSVLHTAIIMRGYTTIAGPVDRGPARSTGRSAMPRYTARHADKAVHLFLLDRGHDEPIKTCPLEAWVQEGPGRFVFRGEGEPEIECTVQFDDHYHAEVTLTDVGSGDVCIRES